MLIISCQDRGKKVFSLRIKHGCTKIQDLFSVLSMIFIASVEHKTYHYSLFDLEGVFKVGELHHLTSLFLLDETDCGGKFLNSLYM